MRIFHWSINVLIPTIRGQAYLVVCINIIRCRFICSYAHARPASFLWIPGTLYNLAWKARSIFSYKRNDSQNGEIYRQQILLQNKWFPERWNLQTTERWNQKLLIDFTSLVIKHVQTILLWLTCWTQRSFLVNVDIFHHLTFFYWTPNFPPKPGTNMSATVDRAVSTMVDCRLISHNFIIFLFQQSNKKTTKQYKYDGITERERWMFTTCNWGNL